MHLAGCLPKPLPDSCCYDGNKTNVTSGITQCSDIPFFFFFTTPALGENMTGSLFGFGCGEEPV